MVSLLYSLLILSNDRVDPDISLPNLVGDRVDIINTGAGTGDTFYVKEIALMYTEFRKLQGHVVQAPNSLLNTLFILNMRRSGALAEVFAPHR